MSPLCPSRSIALRPWLWTAQEMPQDHGNCWRLSRSSRWMHLRCDTPPSYSFIFIYLYIYIYIPIYIYIHIHRYIYLHILLLSSRYVYLCFFVLRYIRYCRLGRVIWPRTVVSFNVHIFRNVYEHVYFYMYTISLYVNAMTRRVQHNGRKPHQPHSAWWVSSSTTTFTFGATRHPEAMVLLHLCQHAPTGDPSNYGDSSLWTLIRPGIWGSVLFSSQIWWQVTRIHRWEANIFSKVPTGKFVCGMFDSMLNWR